MKQLILRGILIFSGGILGGFLFQEYALWQENRKISFNFTEIAGIKIYTAYWHKDGFLEVLK